jgi:hypothetical protein
VLDPYEPAVTVVLAIETVPVLVITPPSRPVPAVIEVTAAPLAADVIRPLESTVKFVSVYDPGVTAVATKVGLGYVPVRSPPAAPPGEVPDMVTFAAAVS